MSEKECTIREASNRLHISKRRVAQLCHDHKIRTAHKILNGRSWLISEKEIETLENKPIPSITQAEQEVEPQAITYQQPNQPSQHKQEIRDLAYAVESEINLPELSDSFFYLPYNQRIIKGNNSGEISVNVSIDNNGKMDILQSGLRSYLETGGFSGILIDIHNWREKLEQYLRECHDFLEMATMDKQGKVTFPDKVERHNAVGYQRNYFISACADAFDILLRTPEHELPVNDESEIAKRNYVIQQVNALWLLMRNSYGGIYVATTERQAKSYLRKHRTLVNLLTENEQSKEIANLYLDLKQVTASIKKQLEKFRKMEKLPGYCVLCVS
jgi:excisionase family DNA binding protein